MDKEQAKIFNLNSEFIVEIINPCEHIGTQQGQIYRAKRYSLDPSKVTLLQRLTDKSRKPIGKDPMCNEYLSNVKILID